MMGLRLESSLDSALLAVMSKFDCFRDRRDEWILGGQTCSIMCKTSVMPRHTVMVYSSSELLRSTGTGISYFVSVASSARTVFRMFSWIFPIHYQGSGNHDEQMIRGPLIHDAAAMGG